MSKRMRVLLPALLAFLAFAAASPAVAQLSQLPPRDVCEPPISLCNTLPIPLASDARPDIYPPPDIGARPDIYPPPDIGARPDIYPPPDIGARPDIYPPPDIGACPDGYTCTCVSSCPECDDCAAQVCVRGKQTECKTACDCPAGLGCFDGRCIAGFAPVYCCDEGPCPQKQQCQHRDGEMDFCADALCEERLKRVQHRIKRWVKRTRACETDDECVRVDTSTGCQGTCGAFINRDYVEKFDAKLDRVDAKFCDGYVQDGCPYSTPSCALQEPACVEGRCTGVWVQPFPDSVAR